MANKPPKPGRGPVVAVPVPATGRAGRDRSTRAGYLARAQHHMLPASWRHSPTANTICHQGPGQQPEVTTGELTTATAEVTIGCRLTPRVTRQVMQGTPPGAGAGGGAAADWRGAITRDFRFPLVPALVRITKNSGPCRAATN